MWFLTRKRERHSPVTTTPEIVVNDSNFYLVESFTLPVSISPNLDIEINICGVIIEILSVSSTLGSHLQSREGLLKNLVNLLNESYSSYGSWYFTEKLVSTTFTPWIGLNTTGDCTIITIEGTTTIPLP